MPARRTDGRPSRAARRATAVFGLIVLVAACRGEGETPGSRPRPLGSPPDPSPGCRAGPLSEVRGEWRSIAIAGEARRYLLDAPSGSPDWPLPVVLAFHGFRADPAGLRAGTGWDDLARRGELIAVHPEGHDGVALLGTTGRGWDMRPDETRDLDFVRALLDGLEAERCVDRRREFATGMSNGGFFASLAGCALAGRLAAVAPVAGALPLEGCTPSTAVPVLLLHGRADEIVPASLIRAARDWWRRADGCRAPVTRDGCEWYDCAADVVYCEGPQGHTWPADATRRIWAFFASHPRA